MESRSRQLSLAVALVLLAAGAQAQEAAEPPDTSGWACSKCTFPQGYASEAELGAGYLDESSAKFGDYTGLDEDGVHVVASAEGGVTLDSGYHLDYSLHELGLDSRAASVEGGKQGAYEFGLSYDRIPHRISDTGETFYAGVGSTDLTLPAGWVRAGSTAGMTALGASLRPVDVGYDRDRYGLFGRFFLGDAWSFDVDYRRDERSGTRPKFSSFGSTAVELLRPVEDSTDRLTATVRYQGARWFAQVGYHASAYETDTAALRHANPYLPFAPGGETGQIALEPDNTYSELSLAFGWYGLPGRTSVTLSGGLGQGKQDHTFVPYTVNPNLVTGALPIADLGGEVDVTRAALAVSSRPIDRLRLRGALSYDERDNGSRQAAFTSIVHTDLFPIGEARVNPVYGYERTRAHGTVDYAVYDDLTVGVGGEWRKVDRSGTRVEVMGEELLDGYGRVQFRPGGYLGFVVKGGALERKPDSYDVAVAVDDYGQNPLMRKFHMAYLYRSYGEVLANVAVGSLPLTLSASAFYGDDSYLQSTIGLDSGLDRRYGVDLNWAVTENVSAYGSMSREKIDSRLSNSSVYGAPDWRGEMQDDYETWGAGVTAKFGDKWRVGFDYTYAQGDSKLRVDGAGSGVFPAVSSELSSFRTSVSYAVGPRADVVASWWYETLDTRDWAFQPQPVVLPTLLGLGVDPYNYDVNFVTLSLRYRFGGPRAEAEAAAEE